MQRLSVEVERHLPVVGMESLVGVMSKDYPLSFGNYCAISDGPYLVNMWAENLREWSRRNQDAGEIEVTVVMHGDRSVGVVTDERLKEWCHDRMCVTGHGWPSVAALKEVGKLLGLPITDRLCGCENEDESPRLSKSRSKAEGRRYRCMRCGRVWQKST